MCRAVYYRHGSCDIRCQFAQPKAMLPVRARSGDDALLPWGRRQREAGALPLGGWARLETIHAGRWDRWRPVPVKLSILSFMEQDIENHERWYELVRGQWLQGLVAREQHERRVYVVTVDPELVDATHARWPRIMWG